jgi:hypothetical protein
VNTPALARNTMVANEAKCEQSHLANNGFFAGLVALFKRESNDFEVQSHGRSI